MKTANIRSATELAGSTARVRNESAQPLRCLKNSTCLSRFSACFLFCKDREIPLAILGNHFVAACNLFNHCSRLSVSSLV